MCKVFFDKINEFWPNSAFLTRYDWIFSKNERFIGKQCDFGPKSTSLPLNRHLIALFIKINTIFQRNREFLLKMQVISEKRWFTSQFVCLALMMTVFWYLKGSYLKKVFFCQSKAVFKKNNLLKSSISSFLSSFPFKKGPFPIMQGFFSNINGFWPYSAFLPRYDWIFSKNERFIGKQCDFGAKPLILLLNRDLISFLTKIHTISSSNREFIFKKCKFFLKTKSFQANSFISS